MKKVIFLIVAFAISAVLKAERYKIIAMNTPSVEIGEKEFVKGDTISDIHDINWKAPREAIKVLNLATRKQELVVSENYTRYKSNSLGDYLSKTKHLSTRNGKMGNVVEIGAHLSDTFYLDDSITIETDMPTDKLRYFFISYDYGGEEINKRIPCADGDFTVSDDIFMIDGKAIRPFETTLSVYYADEEKGTVTLVSDKMHIVTFSFE